MNFNTVLETEYINSGHLACAGCGASLSMRHALKVLGKDTIVVIPASCFSIIAGATPMNALNVPLMHVPFAVSASCASGIKHALFHKGNDKTNVVVWAGDGGTFDIGLQALSGSAERKEDIIYVCYDNEAYMNTGIQRSSATPPGAWTTTTPSGKPLEYDKKDLFSIIVAHKPSYAATANIAFADDFYNKFEKAKRLKGFRFIHILSPCPPGWKMETSKTLEVARLAVDSGTFLLMEYENENINITYKPTRFVPVKEYFDIQGRYKKVDEKQLNLLQQLINKKLESYGLI